MDSVFEEVRRLRKSLLALEALIPIQLLTSIRAILTLLEVKGLLLGTIVQEDYVHIDPFCLLIVLMPLSITELHGVVSDLREDVRLLATERLRDQAEGITLLDVLALNDALLLLVHFFTNGDRALIMFFGDFFDCVVMDKRLVLLLLFVCVKVDLRRPLMVDLARRQILH
eukprot:CAMPEP_0170566936 /NCGR_PEP_ID=MMETSP0211-20121228/80159_1 /TAXON_ID=311385 /ORGANISM="Pseudokeronopsis sp., Strain OXSARD2" /LENGTH=169 /DNA_ID=CAMNT_0010888253 /DNA_START=2472 /DNA_END=2981 /DNA_ORIENTATION=+